MKRYRSAITGRAVTKEFAIANPDTTIAETRRTNMATKAKPAEKKAKTETNDIPESSLTSAITTDLPAAEENPEAMAEAKENQSTEHKESIGLIKVDGIDLRYVGVAPARDKNPETASGLRVTPENSTFTPLDQVKFHPSIRIKDPKTGEMYYPADDARSWADVEFKGKKLLK